METSAPPVFASQTFDTYVEPSEFSALISYFATDFMAIGIPFIAFFIGVHISIILKLNGSIDKQQVYWMAFPVGLLTIGNLLMASTAYVEEMGNRYGHLDSIAEFLMFIGTVTLLGTLVPQLFESARSKVGRDNGKTSPPTDAGDPKPTPETKPVLKSVS